MNAIAPAAPHVEVPMLADLPPVSDSLLNFVAVAVRDPSIEVTKLEALLRMQREIMASDAKRQFNRAFAIAQAEMVPVTRDAVNDQTRSKYARLETIDAAIRPIYTRHGFAMSFDSEPLDSQNIRIICEVTHRDGHAKTYRLEAGLDIAGAKGNANKTPMHGLGSSVSYLRRYLKCMIWDVALANEDNDGNRLRPDGQVSSQPRIDELYTLLADCSADPRAVAANERRFLDKMDLGNLRSLSDVPARDLPRLRNALLTKKSVMAQHAAARQTHQGAAT